MSFFNRLENVLRGYVKLRSYFPGYVTRLRFNSFNSSLNGWAVKIYWCCDYNIVYVFVLIAIHRPPSNHIYQTKL